MCALKDADGLIVSLTGSAQGKVIRKEGMC